MDNHAETKKITKESLIEGYLKLLSSDTNEKLSISNICERAGVSRMAFYRHFKTKDDLLIYHYTSSLQNLYSTVVKKGSLDDFCNTILIAARDSNYFNKIFKFKNTINIIYRCLFDQIKCFFHEEVDSEMLQAKYVCGGILSLGIDISSKQENYTDESIKELVSKLKFK